MSGRKCLLVYIKYLGTNYQGLQILTTRKFRPDKTVIPEFTTIQGVLEHALRKVLQINEVVLHNSSRTDTGVHALSSTLQFEIHESDFSVAPFSPERICMSLNYFLEKNQTDIRIQRVVEVPIDFNCRRAYSRTYNYRIAVAKTNDFDNCLSLLKLSAFLPIRKLNQVEVVSQPFDADSVQQACRLFLGTWNFRSFASLSPFAVKGSGSKGPITEQDLIKTIYKFSFSKTNIEGTDYDVPGYYFQDETFNKLDFFDFHIEGSGFLRRQVRRMIGVLLGVGRGTIEQNTVLQLLKNPSEKFWPTSASTAGAGGLYLKSVNYQSVDVLRGPLS